MSLDTLANVKARLGVSGSGDDGLLALLQDSADAFVQNWCDRAFEGGTFTEYHPGNSSFVYLRNFPVASLTSVKVDPSYAFGAESLVPASAYVLHSEWGVLQALAGRWLPRGSCWTDAPRVVQVVYATATGQVPADVKEAYARLVGHWYRRVKTDSAGNFLNVLQQKYGDTFVIYDRPDDVGAPEDVKSLLAPYRAPRI